MLSCKSRNIDLEAPEAALELLGIEFHPGEAPGGSAVLLFSHGGALRLDVECLECELTDLGADDLGTSDLGDAESGRGRLSRNGCRDRPLQPCKGSFPTGSRGLTAICRRAIEQWARWNRTRPGKPPCLFASTEAAPISPSNSRAFSPSSARCRPISRRATRAIVDDVAARGDAALIEATRKFDRLDIDAGGLRVTPAEIEAAVKACDARDARRAEIRARPDRAVSPPAVAEGRALHRCARRRTRLALERDRIASGFMCPAAPPPIRPRC